MRIRVNTTTAYGIIRSNYFQPSADLLSPDNVDAAFSALPERPMPQDKHFRNRGCREIARFQNGDAAKSHLAKRRSPIASNDRHPHRAHGQPDTMY